MDKFRYTTEHINDVDVLVRVRKKGERKIFRKFVVNDYGDWNAVEGQIESTINSFSESEGKENS